MSEHFVLSHPALPSPLLVTETERAEIVAAVQAQKSHIFLGTAMLTANGTSLVLHDDYREGEARKLKDSRRYICPWGNIHQNEDTGNHDHCKRALSTRNPFVASALLYATEHPKDALPPG